MGANILIGLLGGSLGTLISTKIFDYFSEKRIFKRELKRQFFTRKLEAAEKATKFYISGNNYYTMLQYGFWLFINDKNPDMYSALLQEAGVKCKKLWDEAKEQIAVIGLYFEAKEMKEYPIDNEWKLSNLLSDLNDKDNLIYEINSKIKNAQLINDTTLITQCQPVGGIRLKHA